MMYLKNAIRDSELLGIVDEKGGLVTKTDGTIMTVCRAAAHKYGIIHYTANVLLTCPDLSPAKDIQVLLQRRSKTKDIFPGALTVSCGGHMGTELPARATEAAIREAKEEFGLDLEPARLTPIPEKNRPLPNFLKIWKQGRRTYAQLDAKAERILVPGGALCDLDQDAKVLAYLRSIPPSSLGQDAPLGLTLDSFNREFCFYFLCVLTRDEVGQIRFVDGEAEGVQKIPLTDLLRDAVYMTDSCFTLVTEIEDLEERCWKVYRLGSSI